MEQEEDLKLSDEACKPLLCSFGPETSKTLEENQLPVDLECDHPGIDNMIQKLVEHFSK